MWNRMYGGMRGWKITGLTKKYGQPFPYSEGDTRAKSNTRFSRAFFDFLVTL